MATLTTADVQLSALPPSTGHAGLRGVIASEFTKLRSVRSTYFTLASLVIFSVGVSAIIGFGQASNIHNQPWNKAGTDGTQSILTPFLFIGQLIIAVIGAMVITSEYSTGMIRTSLTAMPRRGIAVSEVRIIPVEYSDVMLIAPITAMISWPSSKKAIRDAWVASIPALFCGLLWMLDAMPNPAMAEMPTLTMISDAIVQ